MSTKLLTISGKQVGFTANGATPPVYEMVFQGEKFFDLFGGQVNMEDAPRLAFIMAMQYSEGEAATIKKTKLDFILWLAQFEPIALETAAADIVGVLTESMETSSDPKPAAG